MVVTINTDASFCFKTKKGAYAFSICSDEFRIEKSGRFKIDPDSSPKAESYAIINATTFFIRHVWPFYQVKELVFYTDSLICVNAINKPNLKIKDGQAKMSQRFKWYMDNIFTENAAIEIPISFRWVKSHQKHPSDKESIENVWCDKMATKATAGHFVNKLIYFSSENKVTNFKGSIINKL